MLRALLLVIHIGHGLGLCAWLVLGGTKVQSRERVAQRWHARLVRILGLRVRVEGAPHAGAHLTVSNHVSWLDIPVLGALEPTRFISKSEVRDWPIAGTLATVAGTFYIVRGKGGAAPVVEQLVPHLAAGGRIALFPEGTTTDGSEVLPFHPRLFAAAIQAGCPVQPVTLHYGRSRDGENVAPFIGDDALVPHIVTMLRNPGLEVRVIYGPPIPPTASRDTLAQEAEDFVRSALPDAPGPAPLTLYTLPVPSRA